MQILAKLTDAELNLNTTTIETIKLFSTLVDRFNEKVLKDNEHWVINEDHYNNIITLLKSRFKYLDNATDSIYDRFDTIHADIEKYIAAEHIITRKQIEKQAKISSKINSRKKQSNNTQK